MMTSELKTLKIKKNDYNLSFAQLKTTKRILQGSTSGSALR